MKGLAESSPFHLLTNPHVINRFIFGHGLVIYYIKVGFKGVYLSLTCFPDEFQHKLACRVTKEG